jgi:hypothetical protein
MKQFKYPCSKVDHKMLIYRVDTGIYREYAMNHDALDIIKSLQFCNYPALSGQRI